MREKWKKSLKVMLCSLLLCLTAAVCLPGVRSEAAAKKPSCAKNHTVYLTRSDADKGKYHLDYTDISSFIFIKNLSGNAKITNIKSSNKRITGHSGLTYKDGSGGKYIGLTGKNCKPGQKTTLTFKVKQGKKTYKLTCKVTLKLRGSNFKTFSIGGKNYASKLKGYSGTGNVAYLKIRPLKGKFRIKMQSGVKLTSLRVLRTVRGRSTVIKLKNGSNVTLKKGDCIQIGYKYTKKPTNYNFKYKGPAPAFPALYTLTLGGVTVINVK